MRVSLRGNHRGRSRGASLIEAAFAVPIFLMLVVGVIDFARGSMLRHLATNAAREGARLAVTPTAQMTTSQVTTLVQNRLGGQLDNPTILVYRTDRDGNNLGDWKTAKSGDRIAVEITASYQPFLSSFRLMPDSVEVRAKSMMTSEAE